MNMQTPGIHHLTLRVADYQRSRKFYCEVLGFKIAIEEPNLFIFIAGSTAIGVRGPEKNTPKDDVFNPFRVGLDHLALGCEDIDELKRVATELERAVIDNTGIKTDETLNKKYVAFKDPDRISWEYYMT